MVANTCSNRTACSCTPAPSWEIRWVALANLSAFSLSPSLPQAKAKRSVGAGSAGEADALTARTPAAIIAAIDRATPYTARLLGFVGRLYILLDQAYERLVRFRRTA